MLCNSFFKGCACVAQLMSSIMWLLAALTLFLSCDVPNSFWYGFRALILYFYCISPPPPPPPCISMWSSVFLIQLLSLERKCQYTKKGATLSRRCQYATPFHDSFKFSLRRCQYAITYSTSINQSTIHPFSTVITYYANYNIPNTNACPMSKYCLSLYYVLVN